MARFTHRILASTLMLSFGVLATACDEPAVEVCEPSGDPISHTASTISADETWPAGIHVVPQTITVRDGATLTLTGCSEIRLGKDASIHVDSGGKALVALGTESDQIRFVRNDASAAWGHLFAYSPGTMTLAWTTLEGGGGSVADPASADFAGASLVARGDPDAPPSMLTVDHVTVKGSTGLGVMMLNARFTSASSDLTITGSGFFPLYTGANAVTELPPGNYTGNATDEILLQSIGPAAYETGRPIVGEVTMHDRGVPYRVGTTSSNIRIGDGYETSPSAQLTIDPGVTLKFNRQGSAASQLFVSAVKPASGWQAQGALVVNGTTEKPVRFTSAAPSPAAGDWAGLYFGNIVDPRSRITNAIVEYAGGESLSTGYCPSTIGAPNNDADCSIILFLEDNHEPSQFITNTRIANGKGCGIYRGWLGSEVDFLATNEFSSLTGCSQSGVRLSNGACSACQ